MIASVVYSVSYLAGVLASVHEACTDHVLSHLEEIDFQAGVISPEGDLHTLQCIRVPHWNKTLKKVRGSKKRHRHVTRH